jgi:hypothetical protein
MTERQRARGIGRLSLAGVRRSHTQMSDKSDYLRTANESLEFKIVKIVAGRFKIVAGQDRRWNGAVLSPDRRSFADP